MCGYYMAFIWDVSSHIEPIIATYLDQVISIVFHYGISTYFVKFHTFPIGSGMGMIWISSIEIPYDD